MRWTLESLETTAGYLQSCPIRFTPGLNCIIGARGTCKSTIIETIRFVFDCDPERIKPMLVSPGAVAERASAQRAGLILETLAGGTARCSIAQHGNPSEPRHVLERNTQSALRVFRDDVQQIEAPDLVDRIEIYSQGDLTVIAENPERRLGLIDRPNQHRATELIERQRAAAAQLAEIGTAIRQRRGEIESRAAKVRGLGDAVRQLGDLRAARAPLPPELESQRVAYEERRKAYEQLRVAVNARARAGHALRAALEEEQLLRDAAALADSLAVPSARQLAAALQASSTVLGTLRAQMDHASDLQSLLDALARDFETESATYYALRKERQQANESLKQEEALTHAIRAMEAVATDLAVLEQAQASALARRNELRAQRDAAGDELYTLRLAQVDAINADYGDQIVLTLQQGAHTARHRQLIQQLLQRSNLRNQQEVAHDLAERVAASDLVDIVEASDSKRLADLLGRDIGQMTRLVSHLLDSPQLYDLETGVPEDGLEITMVVRGEARPLGQLSKGQMATALLPLILRDAEYPLLVDQPEDDLDNAFVSEKLVERIRQLSRNRQLIFVTHNANIPVLGDASNVVVMEMSGPRSAMPCKTGGVDERKEDIIRILEGGTQAFRSRHERYGAALGNAR